LATCFGRKRPSSGQLRTILRYSKNSAQWDPISFTLKLDRPKHVAKYNLIVIIASCLDVCCVLTAHNILYKFDNTQGDGLFKNACNICLWPLLEQYLTLRGKKAYLASHVCLISNFRRVLNIVCILLGNPGPGINTTSSSH